ncbi:MAG: hypothetical protein RJA25_1781 [Bacteroidota bacterium]|jgi:hypothetical protein
MHALNYIRVMDFIVYFILSKFLIRLAIYTIIATRYKFAIEKGEYYYTFRLSKIYMLLG